MPEAATYHLTQEVRIASVMFGGVSLCIYMNGITQELLRAVRATAPASPDNFQKGAVAPWAVGAAHWHTRRELRQLLTDAELTSTEAIYRILGRTLFHGREAGAPPAETGPIRTRIAIDLLAGTSAGGINSVYLAKALVNNQSLDNLNRMWMEQADIDKLLNDSGSDPATYPTGDATTSLLNSTRMYGLLYQAFSDMDATTPGAPLAEELDLYVTATDLDGVALPIQLADTVIEERVHKASFHFTYGPGRFGNPNDFTPVFNPMLAFASRCTSSFPLAFEPMMLEHIDRRLPGLSLAIQQPGHPLHKFFLQFERNNPGLAFTRRPLADGGYLNNKPFSFIVDNIRFRTGPVPVCRKLLFLDPFPELKSQVRHTAQQVGFLENTLDAAMTLPRYQTIREDIERLNHYNRDLYAAQSLARDIEKETPDVLRSYAVGYNPANDPRLYPKRTLSDLERQFGTCYRTYHRLRVSAVTAELATLATWLLGLNDRSDSVVALRMLLHSWRTENYAPDGENGKQLETRFLCLFDVGWRFRRAEYVLGRIDALMGALTRETGDPRPKLQALLRSALPLEAVAGAAERLLAEREEAIPELYRLRDQAEYTKWKISYENERIRGDLDTPRRADLIQALVDTQLTPADLRWILRPVHDEQCQRRADSLYASGAKPIRANITRAANLLSAWFGEILGALSADFQQALNRKPGAAFDPGSGAAAIVREYAFVHFEYFDCRDMQVFTVLQNQLSGEGSQVEIYRISPLDAALLRTNADPGGENKLAGAALFAFGAFLEDRWRRNDVMWGRLDGAERIISALLPDEEDDPLRRDLCRRAFEIIIREEFTPSNCSDLLRPLMAYLRQRIDPAGKTADQFLAEAMSDSADNCPALVGQLLQSIATDGDRLAAFRAFYVRPAPPPPQVSLAYLRRSARIFGDMLQDLQKGSGPVATLGGAVANVTAAVTRFAEFCIPQSMANVFFRYALQLLYAIGIVLIATGALFYRDVETAGWIVVGIAAAANIAAWLVARRVFRQKTGRKIAGALAVIGLLLAVLAALLIRFNCQLPGGAWKAPLYSAAHLLDSRCTQPAQNPPR